MMFTTVIWHKYHRQRLKFNQTIFFPKKDKHTSIKKKTGCHKHILRKTNHKVIDRLAHLVTGVSSKCNRYISEKGDQYEWN